LIHFLRVSCSFAPTLRDQVHGRGRIRSQEPPFQVRAGKTHCPTRSDHFSLGGTAISYVFQSLGEERDARAQQAAFERQNFLDLHRDLNGLIADRVIVMDRVKARLSSGDFAAALSLKRADYDKAVAAWNQNVDRLLRSLKKLGACRPAQPIATDECNGSTPAPTKDCVIDYYYDISWDEERRDKNGSVCKPRSVHFAFKNAGHKLGELLNSDWSDCLELTQSLIDREKAVCRDQPLSAYTKEGALPRSPVASTK
jgi:hypothetical protein